jgi:hypothetical protein
MEIMSAHLLRLGKICGLGCLIVFGTSQLIAADLVLQKVPPLTIEQAPAYPQNLLRHRLGAQVELSTQNNSSNAVKVDALLGDDPSAGYALPVGRTTLLVSLSAIENVDNVSFMNDGARGDVTVASASAKLPVESPQWHKISQQELASGMVDAKIGPTEAKYVLLTFNVTEPGHVAALGVYPTAAVSDFTMPRTSKAAMANKPGTFGLVSYNVTDVHGKTRALYVSSGQNVKDANNMVDGQPATNYSFAANDATPTAVVDLGTATSLRRISAVYSPRPGTVNFYVLQTLPGSKVSGDAPATLRVTDAAQENLQPVATVTDDGSGRTAVDFPATTGRYVMVKWSAAGQQDAPFSVAEIAAFGGQSGNLMASNAGGASAGLMDSDGKTMQDAKDAKDYKEMPSEGPEAPAEGPPPSLPDPPPFTFVPEIVPTSP